MRLFGKCLLVGSKDSEDSSSSSSGSSSTMFLNVKVHREGTASKLLLDGVWTGGDGNARAVHCTEKSSSDASLKNGESNNARGPNATSSSGVALANHWSTIAVVLVITLGQGLTMAYYL